ncbi:DUF805 domain-containing protein [Chelativorans sp.]|uniref:DUF805 domain-containing protein n=1 Tax=Chelativorans sp. TaxID=2203393 RepID=UPI0028113F0D|nr:DUF805 domain-containing protein [Chelativorans sp.]
MNRAQLTWVFFSFSGRVSRAPYFLAGLLLGLFQMFAFYRFLLAPEGSDTQAFWEGLLLAILVVSIWSHLALAAKRLHDFGKPGVLAILLFIPVVSILAFIALCLYPGDEAANKYGERTNAPA